MNQESKISKPTKLIDFILIFFVVVLFILSKIGDGVVWLIKRPVEVIIAILRLLSLGLWKVASSFVSLIESIGKITLTFPAKLKTFSFFTKIKEAPKVVKSTKIIKRRKTLFRFPRLRFSYYSFFLGVVLTIVFVLIPYNLYAFVKALPNPHLLTQNHFPVTTKIYDRNGNLLYEIFAEQNRTPVKLEDIPSDLVNATIAIEDKEFYYHFGFSVRGISRSIKSILVDKKLQGGSTITQQLIKSTLLTPEQTYERKLKEIILAFWAERIYSKDQILEMYLNQVPYGGTAWGIQAAAQTYFGKNVRDLTLAESALLAGLPAAPTYFSPYGTNPELSESRKNQVLDAIVESGKITSNEADEAKKEKLEFAPQITNIKAPHFVMYVKQQLEKKYGIRRVEQGGLRVITSLDLPLQEKAQEIVSNQVEQLKNLSVGNGAALVTNPKTGEILAMVGSKGYFDKDFEGNVNIATSLQQPGSSIKVVTYATALENGFTAVSVLDDSPISYPLSNQPPYAPVNYDGKFHGKITLRKALGNSYNIPAVKVLYQIGLDKMINYGRNMGIDSWVDTQRYGLSLTLGGGEVTMLDMAKVYGTLANSGNQHELTPVLKVTNYEGETLEEVKQNPGKQALKEETAFILSNILADNDARVEAFGPSSLLVIPGKTVAVKTGTSNDKRDNWTIGYTPSYVTTVWVGNNDNSPMNPTLTSGITGATPIWNEITNYILKDKSNEVFTPSKNIVSMPCYGKTEYFTAGTQPSNGCPVIIQNTPTPTP